MGFLEVSLIVDDREEEMKRPEEDGSEAWESKLCKWMLCAERRVASETWRRGAAVLQ